MGFSFTPYYSRDYHLLNLRKENFLAIAIETAKMLDWEVSFIHENGFSAFTSVSLASWSEEISVRIEGDIAHIKSECTNPQLIAFGKNKANIEDFFEILEKLKVSIHQEKIEKKIEELNELLALKLKDNLADAPSKNRIQFKSILGIFIPREGYFITPILIALNLFVFILMGCCGVNVFSPDLSELMDWGGNFRPKTLDLQPWRLVSAVFLHSGILHLIFNLYALFFIGLILEPYLGRIRFLAAYLLTGILASSASLLWYDLSVSVGASGAIFGLYGVFAALLFTNLVNKAIRKTFSVSVFIFIAYSIYGAISSDGGTDNAAHLGGLLSGILFGFTSVPSLKKFDSKILQNTTLLAWGIVTISFLTSLFIYLPNDSIIYYEKVDKFSALEKKALEIYFVPENSSQKIKLDKIEKGIKYWETGIKLFEDCKKLKLPKLLSDHNNVMKYYCGLRLRCYLWMEKSVNENSESYQSKIDFYNKEISGTLFFMKNLEKYAL